MQMSTTHSSFDQYRPTALVIEQLLHPVPKSTVSAHDIISIFAPPRNKSWRRHCIMLYSAFIFVRPSDHDIWPDIHSGNSWPWPSTLTAKIDGSAYIYITCSAPIMFCCHLLQVENVDKCLCTLTQLGIKMDGVRATGKLRTFLMIVYVTSELWLHSDMYVPGA